MFDYFLELNFSINLMRINSQKIIILFSKEFLNLILHDLVQNLPLYSLTLIVIFIKKEISILQIQQYS